jgi:ribonuclease HII
VILPEDFDHKLIDDSKKLKAETLKQAFDLITSKAINWSYALRTPKEVDELNPLWASMSAMGELLESFQPRPALALVDGNKLPISQVKLKAVVHGDAKSLSIAAASIIAKVIRDQLMDEEHARYPQYGFNKHKGYGTKEHLETLARYGPSPIHRLTFRHVRPNETGPVGPRLF